MGTLENRTNFGDQLAVSLRYWVLKGVSHLLLRGFPRAGCGQVVWKSPFNINVPIAFVIKSVRTMLILTIFWLMRTHRRVQKHCRREWAKKAST